ncbi:hypothetical protein GF407_11670 [candidate division KSB1 bacterium]|nr:hypothetical protein [candidate division KSB1 bacterium]
MKNLFYVYLIILMVSLAFSGDISLQYKLEPGSSYKYKVDSSVKMVQEMMGQENVSDIKSDVLVTLTADSLKDETLFLHAVYEDFVIDVSSARIDTTLSMQDLLNKRIKVEMTKWGNTLDVATIDTFPKTQMMQGGSDPEQLFYRFFPKLPVESVSQDGVWQITDPDTIETMGGKVVVTPDVEYTAMGTETWNGHECLKVKYVGDLTLEGEGSQQGFNFFMEGDGSVEGTYYFDAKQGVVVQIDNSSTQDVTIAITGQQNLTIPQSQVVSSKTVLVE